MPTYIHTLLGYLFTITTYKFEITATILITNICKYARYNLWKFAAKEYAGEERLGTAALYGL
jgi:hypothetical protein